MPFRDRTRTTLQRHTIIHLLHSAIPFVQENGNSDLIQLLEPSDHLDTCIKLLHRNDGIVLHVREGRGDDKLTRYDVSKIGIV